MAPWHRACRHYNKSEHSTALYFGFRFSEYECHRLSYPLNPEDASTRRLRNTGNQWTSDTESHIHKFLAFAGSKGALAGSQQPATGPCQGPAESNPQLTATRGTVTHTAWPSKDQENNTKLFPVWSSLTSQTALTGLRPLVLLISAVLALWPWSWKFTV